MIRHTTYPFRMLDQHLLAELCAIAEGPHENIHSIREVDNSGITITDSWTIGHFELNDKGLCDGSRPTSARLGGVMGYAVPPGWLHVDPVESGAPRTFADHFNQEVE